ncbi:hypothetical protein ACHAXM_007500 [Skeletonema potamos]
MGPFTNIKKSRSFNAVKVSGNATLQQDVDADDRVISSLIHDDNEQTTEEDLQETITALRQSIATHADANAETLEHFTTLQKAHDTLYSEHLSLQEQMDDAVELLKYLKEEKYSNESKIKELSTEIRVLKESASGKVGVGVVSLTIENLTKEKMELEEALKEMEEGRQEAISNVERYEIERKEMMDKFKEFGMEGTQDEVLTQKLTLLYEQASRHKEQIRKLEEQSKQRENHDANLQNLLSSMTEEKDRANESITKLQLEKDTLVKEQETMKSQLRSIQHQEEEINRLNATLSDSLSTIAQLKRERNNNNSPAEGHNELLLENESLKYKIQDLQDRIENYSHSAAQKDEVHAQLEREMQERLTKRLAVQLHESKLAMESQIRKELEEEYQSSSSKQPYAPNSKSKSFHDASAPQPSGDGAATIQFELEENLRMQLMQVKEERERWTREQEEFQAKVLLSQQQLSQVRDGYKKKLDREKARVKELEISVSDRESVIGKLSDEYRRAMDEVDEVQMHQETLVKQHKQEMQAMQLELDRLQKDQLGHHDKFDKLKKEMDTLKQKYHYNDEQLQTTLSQLEQINLENEEYVRKLEAFESSTGSGMMEATEFEALQAEHSNLCTQHNELKQKYEGQMEEFKATLQQLEALNDENDEYLRKNVALEIAIEAEKKFAEEMQKKIQSLETDNNKLTSDLSNSEEDRKKLEQSHIETKKLCLETETKLKAVIEEREQSRSAIKDLEIKQEALAERRDKISAELISEKDKLASLTNQYEAVTREKEEHLSLIEVLVKEIEELRSTLVSSEVAWQDRVDSKINEISDSHEKVIQNYETKIIALSAEIHDLNEAKSVIHFQNEENVGRIKELEQERTLLITKDSTQIMRIEELEQEKIQLEEEKQALYSAQLQQKDEIASACDLKVAALTKERDQLSRRLTSIETGAEEYKLQTLDKIDLLTNERDELLEKVENASSEITASSQAFQMERDSLHDMLKQSDLAKQELATKLSALHEAKVSLAEEFENKLRELSSINRGLERDKIALSTEIEQFKHSGVDSQQIIDQKFEQLNIELERLEEVNSELKKEIATFNTAKKESVANSKIEIDKLTIELETAQERCRVLEGGLEDLQLEKEDFETENEELASKLADLTIQAKTMLVRNEEMENQLDELAMEYDCRVSELERQLCDLQEKLEDKSSCDEDEELKALGQKHAKALETIVNLEKVVEEAQQKQDEKEADLTRLKEESLELRQVIDHLQSENDAAREIKYIVLDLKTKNMDLSESLRKSRQQKKAAAEIIERLKTENEKLKKDVCELQDSSNRQIVNYAEKDTPVEKQLVPFEAVCSGDEKKMHDMDAELTHYKAIVDRMMSDRSVFTRRLSELMDSAPLKRRHSDSDGQMKVALLTSGAHPPFELGLVTASSPASTQEDHTVPDEAKSKIQDLTAENVDLAQRLGGAVAEKEFAMTTLSKLGAKMEQLIERNKLLESIADLKSSYAIREGSIYSGASRGHSVISLIQDKIHERAQLDPDEHVGNRPSRKSPSAHELANTTPSILLPQPDEHSLLLMNTGKHLAEQSSFFYDDAHSAFGDSTILSYEPSVKKLDPEQHVKGYLPADVSVEKRNVNAKNDGQGSNGSVLISGNPTSVHDRSRASRLFDGKLIGVEGDFPVDDAMRLTKKLGFVV